MATLKQDKSEKLIDWLALREDFEKKYREIRSEWYVTEDSPDGEDEYGGWVSGTSTRVSPYFETDEDAEVFIYDHDPEPGTHFVLRKRVLREYTEQRWFNS